MTRRNFDIVNDSLVIIPTYNERENVVRMLDTVMHLEFPFDVLVVDDGSPDGTAALVKECQAKHPERIHLLEREGKLGLGTAYIAGFDGRFSAATISCSRWTAISRTIPRTSCVSASLARKGMPACPWAPVTSKGAGWPIGPSID